MQWYLKVLQNYANFEGRARRTEYWMFVLVYAVIYFVLYLVDLAVAQATGFPVLTTLFALAMLIPSLAVGARRLHDTDRTGWWLLIGLIPFVGAIVLLVFTVTEGTRGPNAYGPDPKQMATAAPQPPYMAA